MPDSKYSICGIKNGIPFFFLEEKMPDLDTPYNIEDQIDLMKNMLYLRKEPEWKSSCVILVILGLADMGNTYFTSVLRTKRKQDLLFDTYDFLQGRLRRCNSTCRL